MDHLASENQGLSGPRDPVGLVNSGFPARDRADASVRDGCHLPGHAEAAILAGRVTQMVPDRWDGSWTEVTP